MNRVLLHTFATAGYQEWLRLLLTSVWHHSGDGLDVRADTLNLSSAEVSSLESLHPSLQVNNQAFTDSDIAELLGVSLSTIGAWKRQIEDGRVSGRNYLYKVLISVSKRYRSLDGVIRDSRAAGYDVLIHADSDLYVRTDIAESALIETVLNHDVCMYLNDGTGSLLHTRKVLGAFLAFNLRGKLDSFVSNWMDEIDRVPLHNRWKGFGQSVLWYALNRSPEVRFCNLYSIQDGFRYSRHFEPDADVWLGSNSKLKLMRLRRKLGLNALLGRADRSRSRCWKDFEQQTIGRRP